MGEEKMTEWVDFKQIKSEVTMEMALNHYTITLRQVNATALRGNCPLPTHSDDATTNSFSVSTEKNAWSCQSASCIGKRDGKKGGNVLDFVAVMEGCSIRDAALKLQNWFNVVANNGCSSANTLIMEHDQTSRNVMVSHMLKSFR